MFNKSLKTTTTQAQKQGGVTLMEMVVTIVLFSVMASLGALLISKLSPSYVVTTQTEQTLSAREAALWRLSEDFRQALLDGTTQTGCMLLLNRASGVGGANGETVFTHFVSYEWFAGTRQLWVSDTLTSSLLLNNVDHCPFAYASGSERARLMVSFVHESLGPDPIGIPVSTVFYTYVNGPYVATAVLGGAAVSTVTINGYFPGIASGIPSSVSFSPFVSFTLMPATITQISATVTPIASATVDVTVSTVEGWSKLKQAFQFP